jgi:hypothetical protein
MHVTESPPANIWGSRPTGLGGVVVSASLAPQQRTVIKVPNEGYTSHFFAGRPQIGCRISKYKKRNGEKFHIKKKLGF